MPHDALAVSPPPVRERDQPDFSEEVQRQAKFGSRTDEILKNESERGRRNLIIEMHSIELLAMETSPPIPLAMHKT